MKQKFFWILLPAALWIVLFCLRPVVFHPWCAVQPSPCVVGAVNAFDRIVFHFHSRFADFMSNLVQNTAGVILFLLPILILKNWKRIADLEMILVMGTFWDGAMIELTRAIAQRPRPLVMNNPMGDGANINQYTSFYSGHTSFVAFAGISTYLWMRLHYSKDDRRVQIAALLTVAIVTLTAVLRVMGGRHFPTDTMAGAIAGGMVALVVWTRATRTYSLESI